MSQKVAVTLQSHKYIVEMVPSFKEMASLLNPLLQRRKSLLIVDEKVAGFHLAIINELLNNGDIKIFIFASGEEHKNYTSLMKIIDTLVTENFHRDDCIVAIGGGVVGDIAGLAAHLYLRGIDVIQVPTTLLAQVDAAIGGKTAINHLQGKNLIGAYHQPQAVISSTEFLNTLPLREYKSGIAEIVKYALAFDAKFFEWLEQNYKNIVERHPQALNYAIYKSCEHKAAVIANDEKEQMGLRHLLNFGHTFAHAIEVVTQYKQYLHGEAVAIGMVMAAKLSQKLGFIEADIVKRIMVLLSNFELPTKFDGVNDLFAAMNRDKKIVNRQQVFVLLTDIGKAELKWVPLNEVAALVEPS